MGVMVSRLPILVVLIVGMVLLYQRRTRHPGRAVNIGLVGLAVLFASTLISPLVAIYRTELAQLDTPFVSTGQVIAAAALMAGLGDLVGLGLVIAALVSSVGAATDTSTRTSDRSSDVEH